MRINESHENIVELSVIRNRKRNASLDYGPVNPASTTLLAQQTYRANQEAQLLELLNSLENVVESLNSKSFTVCATLIEGIAAVRVALNAGTESTVGINEN